MTTTPTTRGLVTTAIPVEAWTYEFTPCARQGQRAAVRHTRGDHYYKVCSVKAHARREGDPVGTTVADIEIHEVLHRRRRGEPTRRHSHTVELPHSLVFTSASEQWAFCSALLDQYRAKYVPEYMPEAQRQALREAQEQAHQQTLQKLRAVQERAADERLGQMPTGTQRH